MKAFTQIAFLASVASVATANTLRFVSLDDIDRTVYCTPTVGFSDIEPATVRGGHKVNIKFPTGWIGNCQAVHDGKEYTGNGMLAEIAWDQFEGKHFFDVSAIVDPNDKDNVREMYPKSAAKPKSGCKSFPCNDCYYLPDDVQTKVTDEDVIIVTLGEDGLSGLSDDGDANDASDDNDDDDDGDDSDASKREEHPAVGRNYVMGKF